MNKVSILIVDPDLSFLDSIGSKKTSVDIKLADDRKKAQLLIADKAIDFSAICVSPKACEPIAIPLVRFAKVHRPSVPIYLLNDGPKEVPAEEELDRMHIQSVIQKPIETQELVNSIFPYTFLEMKKLIDLAEKDKTLVDSTLENEENHMHPISAKSFLCGSKSFFDIYVRLSPKKFIKILRAGDQFDSERVNTYLKKGVIHFYMKREAQELFLQYCDKLTGAILQKKDLALDVKINQVANFGKETSDFLKHQGHDERSIHSAKQFVNHSRELAKQLAPSVLDGFMKDLALCDHGTGTVLLLSLLVEGLGYKDPTTIEVIAMGGFFHDIGLMNMPEKFQLEDRSSFSPQELKEYEEHPFLGEALIRGIRRINPLIPQIVLQHHERRNCSGFPNAIGHGELSPIAEIVGLADQFNQWIKRAASDPEINPYEKTIFMSSKLYSASLIETFKKVFGKK